MNVFLAVVITAVVCTPLGYVLCALLSANKCNDNNNDKINNNK
jgi:hypothetical protein